MNEIFQNLYKNKQSILHKKSKRSKYNKNEQMTYQLQLQFINSSQNCPFINNSFTQTKILQFILDSVTKMNGKITAAHLLPAIEINYISKINKTIEITLKQINQQLFHKFWSSLCFGTIAGNNKSFKIILSQLKIIQQQSN